MHHHPKYWDSPDEFNPLRFTAEAEAARPQYAYLPFGGGPRRCVGMRFAQLEGVLLLAVLGQSFAPRMKPGFVMQPRARVNLHPHPGLQMFLEPRRNQVAATA
jgi:cytochrome P450